LLRVRVGELARHEGHRVADLIVEALVLRTRIEAVGGDPEDDQTERDKSDKCGNEARS